MRLAVVLEALLESGGGFNQALSAALQAEQIAGDFFHHYVVRYDQSRDVLSRYTDRCIKVVKPRATDMVVKIGSRFDRAGDFSKLSPLTINLEREFLKEDIDLAYFVTPSATPIFLRNVNYMYTVWDICHRDAPEFPEVRDAGEARWRDFQLSQILPRAVLTLVDSNENCAQLSRQFGVRAERFLAMPFSVAPHLKTSPPAPRPEDGYLYYPAQFWAHKNHVRVLEALEILSHRNIRPNLVLSGGDKGQLDYVKEKVVQFGLDREVTFRGFVEPDEMQRLYEGAAAVLMPSYFGPTNLPPLEAWALKRPLVCSTIMKDQVADAAITVDPDCAVSWAKAIAEVVQNKEIADTLVERGTARLREIEHQRAEAESMFRTSLESYDARRRNWR